MYEQQKAEFEAALIRSELRPVPGDFWIHLADDGRLSSVQGQCCALSPILLERQLHPIVDDWEKELGIPSPWADGAAAGFDGRIVEFGDDTYLDGYEWGQYMRRKYYLGEVEAS